MQEHRIKVWDLPLRLFHWLLVISVALAFATGLQGGGWMVWHGRIGLWILALLVFRLTWGIIGSTYARFGQFVRGPAAIRAYLNGRWHGLGHNPLGAISVLAMLGLLSLQAGTGLFATDDIAFSGTLKSLVGHQTSLWLSGVHRQAIWVLGGLILLHIAATVFYLVRGQNLIRPMVTGYVLSREPMARPAEGGGILALLLALAIAGGSVWVANGGLLSPPPPPVIPAW